MVGRPLDPWQRWVAIHALEVLPGGRPRFRQVLILVARQNGKTELLVLLTLFWMFIQQVPLVLGTSTKLDYAKESWVKAIKLAKSVKDLADEIAGERKTNGEQDFWTNDWPETGEASRYKIGASNDEGGRSLTVHRLIEDELRQHHDWSAHEAAENAMNAVSAGQAWAISNAGSKKSVVLNALRAQALEFIKTGEGDESLGLIEYSAPEGCDVTDLGGLAQANPNLGRRIDVANLLGKAVRAKQAGGEQETKFRTEVLCQSVRDLIPKPITVETWAATQRDVRPTGRPVFFVTIESGGRSGTIAVAADDRPPGPHLIDGIGHPVSLCPIPRRLRNAAEDATREVKPGEPCRAAVPHVELADNRPGTWWMPARLQELRTRHPEAPMAAMAVGPVADLEPELTRLGVDIELLPASEMIRACGHVEKLGEGFTHSGEAIVDLGLAGMEIRRYDQGTWGLDWKSSKGNLAPFAAEIGALWLLEKNRDDDYNLMDSFG